MANSGVVHYDWEASIPAYSVGHALRTVAIGSGGKKTPQRDRCIIVERQPDAVRLTGIAPDHVIVVGLVTDQTDNQVPPPRHVYLQSDDKALAAMARTLKSYEENAYVSITTSSNTDKLFSEPVLRIEVGAHLFEIPCMADAGDIPPLDLLNDLGAIPVDQSAAVRLTTDWIKMMKQIGSSGVVGTIGSGRVFAFDGGRAFERTHVKGATHIPFLNELVAAYGAADGPAGHDGAIPGDTDMFAGTVIDGPWTGTTDTDDEWEDDAAGYDPDAVPADTAATTTTPADDTDIPLD